MTSQPHPDVTSADVERIVRRDYAPERVAEVLALLNEYGPEDWHREPDRVRLAVLKLAAGRMEQLRYHIAGAKMDYRDVLGPAEYPGYTKRWFRMAQLPPEEQEKIIAADWKQYQSWFERP